MIKQIGHLKANTKSGYKYNSVKLLLPKPMDSPILKRISIYDFKKFYTSELRRITKRVNIKIKGNMADIMPVYIHSQFWCVSEKFKNIFENKLHGSWFDTNNSKYYLFLIDNIVDVLDKDKTTIVYSNEDRHHDMPWTYQYIENEHFINKAEEEYLFEIPECIGVHFCSEQFQNDLIINNITGYQLYKDLNFTRKDGFPFDWLRQGKYDIDGNCLS